MKNTTFRKKALLSSVAMLLVALVALGSATFAWFTQNPTVTADGLSLKATAEAGLQILSNSEKDIANKADTDGVPDAYLSEFGTSTTLKAVELDETDPKGVTLGTPVSLDCDVTNAVTFRTTTAALETKYDAAEDEDGKIAISEGVPSYSETLWLRSSVDNGKTVTVKSAKVTFEKAADEGDATGKLYPAIRVTLVDNETKAVIGTWSSDGVANTYLTETGVSGDVYTKAYGQGAVASMEKTVDYSGAKSVEMIVWLDGEDDACYTANVENLKNLVSSIKVQFSTKTTI